MKKICIIGILILLTLIPITSAIDVSDNVDNELYENPATTLSNDGVEIITFIPYVHCYTNLVYIPKGFIEFYIGSIEMFPIEGSNIHIHGVRKYNGNLEDMFFSEDVTYMKASLYMGLVKQWFPDCNLVVGIALGDIEWS